MLLTFLVLFNMQKSLGLINRKWKENKYLMSKYFIQPRSGIRIEVNKGQKIEIIDVDGGQVADFFAEIKGTHDEYVSPSVTIDCNESLKIEAGSIIYSNQYKPMFRVESDDVGVHDLLFMNTVISEDGKIEIKKPISKAVRFSNYIFRWFINSKSI